MSLLFLLSLFTNKKECIIVQNSKMFVDIMVKDLMVVIAVGKVRDDGALMVTRKVKPAVAGAPSVTTALAYAASEIESLTEVGFAERIAVILPEQAIIRAAEAQKLKNQGCEDIGSVLVKPWMLASNELEAESWQTSLNMFGLAVKRYQGTIVWQNARALYRWEVKGQTPDGSDLVQFEGQEITFTSGVNAEHGLVVESPYYNETAKLTLTKIRQRNGNFRYRAFVPRIFTVRDENDEVQRIDAFTASNPDLKCEGTRESFSAAINALRLHVKAAEKLPRIKVASKIIVEDKA